MTKPILLLLILLTACATPPRPTMPPASQNVGAAMIAAQMTSTSGAMAVGGTQEAIWNETGTRVAGLQIKATETAVSSTATRSFVATGEAVVAGTATSAAWNREKIELEALTTRRHAETVASVTAVYLDSERNINNAKRSNVGWWGFVVVSLILFFLLGYTLVRIINNRADYLYFVHDEPADPQPRKITGRVLGVRTRRSETIAVDEIRDPFELMDDKGKLVHRFDGNALDNMETNVRRGDTGFRRGTSGDNLGLDDLAGIRGGDKYTPVLSAMKHNGYVESVGMISKWTTHGVKTVLGMKDGLPS